MTRDALRKLIESCYRARRFEKAEQVLSFFSEDAVFRIVANEGLGDLGRTLRGHDALLPFFEKLFTDWDWKDYPIKSIHIDDDETPVRATVYSAGTMLHTPSKQRVAIETLDLVTFNGDKVVDFLEFVDTDLLRRVVQEAGAG